MQRIRMGRRLMHSSHTNKWNAYMGAATGVALPLRSTLARPLRTMDGVALALSTALHALAESGQ